jgi:hypothetical protein
MSRKAFTLVTIAVAVLMASCGGTPAGPAAGPLALGRWSGDACLSVADTGCNLVVGCGHGQFPRPTLDARGTFQVSGTYRIEVGPISIDPPPPAQFLGMVTGTRLLLTVMAAGAPAASYSLTLGGTGTCSVPCL